jgi:tetratricopeptide (TPR) repeat protein
MKYVAFLLILFIPFLINAQSLKSIKEAASKCIDSGDYSGAIAKYNSVLKLNKNDFESLKNRAFCFEKIDKFELAIKDNLILLNFDKSGETHGRIAFEYMVLNQNVEARSYLEKAMILQPNEIKNQYNFGLTFQREKEPQKAIEIYNKVLLVDSLHIPTMVSKVRCHIALEEFDKANELIERFFNNQLFSEEMLILRGDINSHKGLAELALNDYSRAIAILPNDIDLLDKYTDALNSLKFYSDEISVRYRVIDILHETKGSREDLSFEYRKIGLAQFSLGLHQNAKESLDKSINLFNKDSIAYFYRCAVKVTLGDNEGGCLDLNKAKDLSPDESEVFNQFFIDGEGFDEFVELCLMVQ